MCESIRLNGESQPVFYIGEKDNLTSGETISEFSNRINADLTVMDDGEHWFHTDAQMKFLDDWIINSIR